MNELMVVEPVEDENQDKLPWITVPVVDEKDRLRMLAITSNPALLKDHNDEVLRVTGWIVEAGTRTDRATGNPQPCINTTLITDNGAYFTQSNGVARFMRKLRTWYPDGPSASPDGYIMLKNVKVQAGNGNEIRTLVPVIE